MFTENEGHKTEVRRQSQNEERLTIIKRQSWTSHFMFLYFLLQTGTSGSFKNCIFQKGKQGGTFYPKEAGCFLSGLLHKIA